MKHLKTCILPILLLASLGACDQSVLGDEPGRGHVELFDQVWEDLDRNYTYFELKGVDWDSVRRVNRPQAASADNGTELFYVMSDMLDNLKDGHVNLYADKNHRYNYNAWYEAYPANYNPSITREYIHELSLRNLYFGRVEGTSIAYVRISTFSGDTDPGSHLRSLLEANGNLDALIIDIRSNGGGSDRNSRKIAGYFADRSHTYAWTRYKNGHGHGEFAPWQAKTLDPSSEFSYAKPIALLTNRRCFSSCEDFVLAMRIQPEVTVVGDTTGGGAGNPVSRELPNGWTYRFSTWQQVTPEMEQYEGRGLYPDIPVWISKEQEARGEDAVLEQAVEHLRSRLGTGAVMGR